MAVSVLANKGIKWWLNSITNAYNDTRHINSLCTLITDASLSGCSADFGGKSTRDSFAVSQAIVKKECIKTESSFLWFKKFL